MQMPQKYSDFQEQDSMTVRSLSGQKSRSAIRAEKNHAVGTSGQAYCFALLGIDPAKCHELAGEERKRLVRRIDRMICRERQKGIGGLWSYDLNRHIALKQLREWLKIRETSASA